VALRVPVAGDPTRAEDVVRETLQRAAQHPGIINGNERSTRAWLFTVARNMSVDDGSGARFGSEVISPDGSGASEVPGPDEVDPVLDRTLVGDAMAQLSAEHRAVVLRAYYYGWTTTQIGVDLGIGEGTVKSRLHYALRALRQTLAEDGGGAMTAFPDH
jgi:RNA polymerase sigma-70 factor, ECF subfamily